MTVTPVLFLHGLESNPQGKKARYLSSRYLGFAPALTTRVFATALDEARAAIRERDPAVVVGSSFGGALLLALLTAGDWRGPAVFVAQAGVKLGIADALPEGSRAILIHGTADDVVAFEGSARLAASTSKGAELWAVEGGDHRLDVILADGTLARAVDALLLEASAGPTLSETLAAGYAAARHGEQRYGDQPYAAHLAAVRAALEAPLAASELDEGARADLRVAAWLHDVVEDTPTPLADVAQRFGERVAALVWAVTGVGENRKTRNADAYAKIRATPASAWLKLADRIANVEASRDRLDKRAMYAAEHASFAEALSGLGAPALWDRLARALHG
ncbi:MAG: HD domain-containing protein [Polyangiaceae bacterium]